MKKTIITLRIIATIFLVGVVFTLVKTPSGFTHSVGVIAGGLKFNIGVGTDDIYISSALLGFIISLVATIFSIRLFGNFKKFKWPMILAILGIFSLTNEITRLFHDHIRILMSFPLLQVIADWLSLRHFKR